MPSVGMTTLGVGSVMGQWKAGQVKVLSFMSTQRNSTQPDVPAISEDLPGFRPFSNWIGFVAPAGTPAPIIERLARTFQAVIAEPEVKQRIVDQQWSAMGGSPADFKATIDGDMPVIAAAFKSTGIQPE